MCAPALPARKVDVDVVGARDIRVIDMKQSEKGGTFVVTHDEGHRPGPRTISILPAV